MKYYKLVQNQVGGGGTEHPIPEFEPVDKNFEQDGPFTFNEIHGGFLRRDHKRLGVAVHKGKIGNVVYVIKWLSYSRDNPKEKLNDIVNEINIMKYTTLYCQEQVIKYIGSAQKKRTKEAYIVMEYIEGSEDLFKFIEDNGVEVMKGYIGRVICKHVKKTVNSHGRRIMQSAPRETTFDGLVNTVINGIEPDDDLGRDMEEIKNIFEWFQDNRNMDIDTIIMNIVTCLRCLHSKKIAHRDIKLQNVVIVPNDLTIKFIDFDMSCINNITGSCSNDFVGTLFYMAPEVLKFAETDTKYDIYKTDIWSLGCMFYEILYEKKFLIIEGEIKETFKETKDPRVILPLFQQLDLNDILNPNNKYTDLLKWMLTLDPSQRPNIDQVYKTILQIQEHSAILP